MPTLNENLNYVLPNQCFNLFTNKITQKISPINVASETVTINNIIIVLPSK